MDWKEISNIIFKIGLFGLGQHVIGSGDGMLLTHWSYCSLVLSHLDVVRKCDLSGIDLQDRHMEGQYSGAADPIEWDTDNTLL